MDELSIANKLLCIRASVIALIGREAFMVRVEEYRPILRTLCEKRKINETEGLTLIVDQLKDDGHAQLLAVAACIEIITSSP